MMDKDGNPVHVIDLSSGKSISRSGNGLMDKDFARKIET